MSNMHVFLYITLKKNQKKIIEIIDEWRKITKQKKSKNEKLKEGKKT
jgi:hypothetical protein